MAPDIGGWPFRAGLFAPTLGDFPRSSTLRGLYTLQNSFRWDQHSPQVSGSATLWRLALPVERDPNFPMEEIPQGQYRCKINELKGPTFHFQIAILLRIACSQSVQRLQLFPGLVDHPLLQQHKGWVGQRQDVAGSLRDLTRCHHFRFLHVTQSPLQKGHDVLGVFFVLQINRVVLCATLLFFLDGPQNSLESVRIKTRRTEPLSLPLKAACYSMSFSTKVACFIPTLVLQFRLLRVARFITTLVLLLLLRYRQLSVAGNSKLSTSVFKTPHECVSPVLVSM